MLRKTQKYFRRDCCYKCYWYKNTEEYFSNLKYLIIDELHNIIHSKRGDLLALNIARLNEIVPCHNKIALSATLKDINTGLATFLTKRNLRLLKV